MKISIVGGHLSPALSIIQALPKDTDIIYIGRKNSLEGDTALSLEYQKISQLGIPFINLTTARLQRRFTRQTLSSLFKLPGGLIEAYKILRKFKPDVVVCFGGYLQIPVAFAAYILKIPIITHEQTLNAGLANKIIAPFASTVCISWQESAKYFPAKKTFLTGLPLRKEFYKIKNPSNSHLSSLISLPRRQAGPLSSLYITGGSQGAHSINVLIENILEKLLKKYNIIHQTGDSKEYQDFSRLENLKNTLPEELRKKYKIFKFIDPAETASVISQADLVISRSGMNTVAELIFLEKPSLLIPLPHGQNNEQLKNALFMESLGLAKVLEQNRLTPEILYSQVVEFTAKLKEINKSSQAINKFKNHYAAEKIVKIIEQTANQKK